MHLSEQEQIRRDSLAELRKLGIDPYPAAEFKTNVFAQKIIDEVYLTFFISPFSPFFL